VAFVLQLAAMFSAVGGLVALRARRRFRGADTARITQAWAGLGFLVGAFVAIVDALV
jgi:hypothetical protein